MCINCGNLIKAIDAYIAKADNNLAATLGEEGYIEPQETVEAISSLEERVTAALLSETDYIIKAVDKADSLAQFQMDIWPKLKEGDTLQDDLQAIFQEDFDNIVRRFAGLYFSAIENGGGVTKASIEIVRVSKQTTAWVQNWSQELAGIMKLNSHKEIEAILTKGLEGGIGIPEFSRNIIESGIRNEWYKARRVAVTEVLTAHRAGQQEAYLQSPSTSAKMWRHTGIYIHGPRQNHKDMDGRKVPKDQPFELLGADGRFYHPMFPGDPLLPPGERIECHCTTQGIVDEDVLGLPLEERQRLQQEAIDELDDKWEKELEDRNKALAGFTEGNTPLTSDPSASTIDSSPFTPDEGKEYNDTAAQGHRELIEGEDYISRSSYATGEHMKEMGASEITDEQRDVVDAIIDGDIFDETDGDLLASTIGGYIGSPHSYIINEALRSGNFDSLSDLDKETVSALRKVIDNNTCDTDLLFDRYTQADALMQYTGVDPSKYLDKSGHFKSIKAAQAFVDAVNKDGIGKVITEKGFVSVSYNPKANKFVQFPVKMEIAVMPYTNMYVTDNWEESEVILQDGSQFRLCACRAIGKQVCLELGKVVEAWL